MTPEAATAKLKNTIWFGHLASSTVKGMKALQHEGFWYIATPYTLYPGGREAAFIDACRVGAWLIQRGVHVFVPIAHTHPIAKYGAINAAQIGAHGSLAGHDWLAGDLPLINAAVGICVVMMPTWEISHGVAWERQKFSDAMKPEIMMPWPLED